MLNRSWCWLDLRNNLRTFTVFTQPLTTLPCSFNVCEHYFSFMVWSSSIGWFKFVTWNKAFIVHVFFQVTYPSTNALCIMYDIIEHFYPSTGDGSWEEFNIMPIYSESTHSMIVCSKYTHTNLLTLLGNLYTVGGENKKWLIIDHLTCSYTPSLPHSHLPPHPLTPSCICTLQRFGSYLL